MPAVARSGAGLGPALKGPGQVTGGGDRGDHRRTEAGATPVRAAQYVRMSTEHQQYSTENQAHAIRQYADRHGLEIVRTYADEGRSGLRIEGRDALQRLIADVESGAADFTTILVYDVSRWGRFPDADESAHYEYRCRRAGIQVRYCAEPFENDGSALSTIVKGVKRMMATEYSSELSKKVFAGQCRLIEHGFRQGGAAGYGFGDDQGGTPKGELTKGEHKSIQTDRVVLVPGPPEEVSTVQWMYRAFVVDAKPEGESAETLNARGVATDLGRPWTRGTVHQVLINPKYVGDNVWNRVSFKLKQKRERNRPEKWVRAEAAFEGIVDRALFDAAAAIIAERARRLTDEDLLSTLRALFEAQGRLSGLIIDETDGPSSSAYRHRFGSLLRAYSLVGYSAEEVKRKLEAPSELLLEIIGRMEQMDRAAQIRIADELFGGTAGERFVELLDQGEAGIRATIDRAHEPDIVMSDNLIATAAELDGMFRTIANTVGVELKSAIVSAADSLVELIESFRSFENQRTSTLEERANDLIRQKPDLAAEQRAVQADDGLTENARKLGFGAADSATTQKRVADLQAQIDALSAQEDQIIAELQNRTPIAPPKGPTDRTWTPPTYTPPAGGSGSGGSGGSRGGGGAQERADDFDREAEALIRRTQALKAGTLAQSEINPLLNDFGRAAEFASARTDLLLAAQQAGIPVTAELRAQVDQLAGAYADATVAQAQLDAGQQEAVQAAEEIQRLRGEATQGFVRDLLDGVSAADALASALDRVADRMIDMALQNLFAPSGGGAGGGAGILGAIGSLFGFANGTANTGGRRGEVRGVVHGREAVILLPDGRRVPVEMRGAGGVQDVRVRRRRCLVR
nr:recombinase family protein [Amaricoccus sp.]